MNDNAVYVVSKETNRVNRVMGVFRDKETASTELRRRMAKEVTIQLGADHPETLNTLSLLELEDCRIDALLTELFRYKFNNTYFITEKVTG